MYTQKFRSLYKDYTNERGDMAEDQFAALLYTFPSVLVANADGNIDSNEKDFMQFLPEIMVNEEEDSQSGTAIKLTVDYFRETEYLLQNLSRWQDLFLDTLSDQLKATGNEKNAIFRSMWRTADSSNDISEEERKVIDKLTDRLGL